MTPPVDYHVMQHNILSMSLAQERKIMELPVMKAVYNKEGDVIGEEIDTKLLQVQQKISENTKNRLMGMPVARSMQLNKNINQNAPSLGVEPSDISPDMDEAELQAFIDANQEEQSGGSDVIETTARKNPE
jgi:hypothetical protein